MCVCICQNDLCSAREIRNTHTYTRIHTHTVYAQGLRSHLVLFNTKTKIKKMHFHLLYIVLASYKSHKFSPLMCVTANPEVTATKCATFLLLSILCPFSVTLTHFQLIFCNFPLFLFVLICSFCHAALHIFMKGFTL